MRRARIRLARCRRCRCTCTCRGACASARTATSTRTSANGELPEDALPRRAARRPRSRAAARSGAARCTRCSSAAARRACSRPRRSTACCRTCARALPLDADAEITLEANPGTFESARSSRRFARAGVNRLSIGMQSFNDAASEGARPHPRRDAGAPRGRSRARPLRQLQPRPDVRAAGADARRMLERDIDDGAGVRAAAPVALPPDDRAEHAVRASSRRSCPTTTPPPTCRTGFTSARASAGYEHYEVSAYAQPHRQCRHNLNYWRFGDYLGIGAGAHTQAVVPAPRSCARCATSIRATYMERGAGRQRRCRRSTKSAPRDLPFEFMLNALRLRRRLSGASFIERTGLSMTAIEPALAGSGTAQTDYARLREASRRRRSGSAS